MDLQKHLGTLTCILLTLVLTSTTESRPKKATKKGYIKRSCDQKNILQKLEEIKEYLQKGLINVRKTQCLLGDAIDAKKIVKGKSTKSKCTHDNRCQLGFDYSRIAKRDSVSIFRFTLPVMQSFKESLMNAVKYEKTVAHRLKIPGRLFDVLQVGTKGMIASMTYTEAMIDACEGTADRPSRDIGEDVVNHFPETASHKHYCTADKDEQVFTVLKQMFLSYQMMQWDIERRLYTFGGGMKYVVKDKKSL